MKDDLTNTVEDGALIKQASKQALVICEFLQQYALFVYIPVAHYVKTNSCSF